MCVLVWNSVAWQPNFDKLNDISSHWKVVMSGEGGV